MSKVDALIRQITTIEAELRQIRDARQLGPLSAAEEERVALLTERKEDLWRQVRQARVTQPAVQP